MDLKLANKYSTAGILLLASAAVLLTIPLFSNFGDITNGAFVISSMVCAMTGIFALTFYGAEPLDSRLVGLLPAQESINLCRIIQHFGIQGNAYFLPPGVTGRKRVMQFNPTSTYDGKQAPEKGSLWEPGSAGIVTPPSCALLIQDLRKRNTLVIPDKEEELSLLIRETIEDVYNFAPRVSVGWSRSTVTITFHTYAFIDGCTVIAEKSPQCCSMRPCPLCSLCGALIAEGLDKVVALDQCSISSSAKDVTVSFSILPRGT